MSSKLSVPVHLINPSAARENDVVLSSQNSRREFIHNTLLLGMSLVIGCGTDEPVASGAPSSPQGTVGRLPQNRFEEIATSAAEPIPGDGCPDPFANGEWLGNMVFTSDDAIDMHTPLGVGWDGRLYTDLATLDDNKLVTPNDEFYIRTLYPDQLNPDDPWSIQISGLVTERQTLTMADIEPLVEPMGVHVLECSGNWQGGGFGLLSAAAWSGVEVTTILNMLDVSPEATRVVINGFDGHSQPSAGGHSRPGASWVFTFDELAAQGAFFATQMNGETLPLNHGYPIRLVVPGWYGCTCIKWVNGIRLVDEEFLTTSQMREFASRTHQDGVPTLARDYRPASMDQAAMPVRVEKWRVDDDVVYKVVGIMWGGYEPTDGLMIQLGDEGFQPVTVCPEQTTNATWTLWSHLWKPQQTGDYDIALQISDDNIPTRRLDMGWYIRTVRVDEV